MTKKELENLNTELLNKMSVIYEHLCKLRSVCDLGINDVTLETQDVKNILRDVLKKINAPLITVPQEAKELVKYKNQLEKQLYSMLQLSQELSDKTALDMRQIDAIDLLPKKYFIGKDNKCQTS